MNEMWSIRQIFENDDGPLPFHKGPEEMLLWEAVGNEEARCVFRAYDEDILKETILEFQKSAEENVHYFVEFPGRKRNSDSAKKVEKRKFTGAARCLPNSEEKLLINIIENKWGATLDEQMFMKSNGKTKAFYMKTDPRKETVFTFKTWDEVKQMAFTKNI